MAKRIAKQIIPDNIDYWPECDLCPKLCVNSMNVCMEGDGPMNADIMFIGEAPGETEDDLNLPFVGQAGEYLRDDLMLPAKIPESKVRFTNSNRCHPKNNKTPSVMEIKKCRRYLEVEIRKVNPKVIVALGNAPLASIMQFFYKGAVEEGAAKKTQSKVSGIGMWRGNMIWLQEFQCWLMPTYHPSFCMRNERSHSVYSTNQVIDDLKLAWSYTKKVRPENPMPKSVFVTTVRKAFSVLADMRKSKEFAFDIETGGKGRSIDKRVIGCSFANSPDIGYYMTWELLNRNKELFQQFKKVVSGKMYFKIMHNGAYEVRILAMAHGIKINNVKYFDTMVSAHLINENFSKRLKDLTWLHTVFGGYDVELEKYKYENHIKEDYSKIPLELLAPYGGFDSVATWILYKKFVPAMEAEGLTGLYNKIVMPVRRVMSDAEINGMRVDIKRAKKLQTACSGLIEKLETQIYELAGKDFNIGSPKQLSNLLYNDMGFDPLRKTKTGFSADADSLAYISTQPDSKIASVLLERSYVSTMLKTHINQAVNFRWPEDGRVHTNYNLTAAVTGRCSASQPSLQNVPADRLIRSLYVASPGNMLVEADLKSAEMAAIAAISGEEAFVRAFQEGLDIHSVTYRKMYDLPDSYQPTKLERRKAKTINFGLVYGMTAIGLAQGLGVTIEEATEFMNLYFQQLPNIARWMTKQRAIVRRDGYVVSIFGRKRRIPYGMSDRWGDIGRAERQAMNSPIQSCAADYTYIGLTRLRRSILKEHMEGKIVHTVHDCVVTDTPKVEVPRMAELIQVALETPVKAMPIRMKVDVEINKRWGQTNESKLEDVFERMGIAV